MQRIIVDPQELEITAQKVESASDEYQSIYRTLYGEVDKMAASWQGKENQEFTNRIKSYENDLRQINIIIRQYAEFVRNSARAYRETQDELYANAGHLRQGA